MNKKRKFKRHNTHINEDHLQEYNWSYITLSLPNYSVLWFLADFRMILLEVENRAVEEALNAHFEIAQNKGRFDNVDAKICDFDGCSYHLIQPKGQRDVLQVKKLSTVCSSKK